MRAPQNRVSKGAVKLGPPPLNSFELADALRALERFKRLGLVTCAQPLTSGQIKNLEGR
jgi:hypothetical protein